MNPGRVRVLNQVGGLYPCTVCRKGFKTRIEMIAHRSDTIMNGARVSEENAPEFLNDWHKLYFNDPAPVCENEAAD